MIDTGGASEGVRHLASVSLATIKDVPIQPEPLDFLSVRFRRYLV